MKKKMSILVLILVLTLVAGCTMNQTNDLDGPSEEEPSVPTEDNNSDHNSEDTDQEDEDKDNNDEEDEDEDGEESGWQTYSNSRFNFIVDIPKDWEYNESTNNDGIAFFMEDQTKDIRIYASNYMEDSMYDPYEAAKNEDLTKEEITLDSGIDATIIEGEKPKEYYYEMIYINDDVEYHFISVTPVDYFYENEETIRKITNSFNVTDNQ